MKTRLLFPALTAIGLVALLCTVGPRAQEPAGPQDGLEPLTSGPVHEAFAQPVTARPGPNPIIPQKPPEPIEELPPEEKPEGDNVVWIPGYWAWEEATGEFLWVSGFWRDVPPDRTWIPGYWTEFDGGWQWTAGYWAEPQPTIEYLPEPPQSIEAGPSVPAPEEDSLYVPGCWIHRETRYVWRPGFWIRARADWDYVPAHYVWAPAGCIFVEGYWDRPLPRRGLLFCPVRFARPLWQRAGWYYRPVYAVYEPALVTALFVNTHHRRYHFGDYYAPDHQRRGFVPWFNYRPTRNVPDPLFAHYRVRHRAERGWTDSLVRLYEDRREGRAPRPPRTIIEQNRIIREITVNQKVRIGDRVIQVNQPREVARQLTLAVPLPELRKQANIKLQPVPKERLTEVRKVANRMQTIAQERRQVEARLIEKREPVKGGKPVVRPLDRPVRAKLDLPKLATVAKEASKVKAPPPPKLPPGVERKAPKGEPTKPIRVEPPPKGKPAPKEIKPPPKEVKPPPKEVKPPPKGKKPPPKEVKPPPKEVKPPPKEVKPPPKEVKPLPKEVKPPPKEVKPPPKEVKPPPKPEGKPLPKPEVKPQPKPEVKPPLKEVKPPPKEVKPPPKPEVKPPPKPEVKPPPKPEVKPQPKPEVKPPPKPEVKPLPKPEVKPPPKEVKPAPPKPESKPRPKDRKDKDDGKQATRPGSPDERFALALDRGISAALDRQRPRVVSWRRHLLVSSVT